MVRRIKSIVTVIYALVFSLVTGPATLSAETGFFENNNARSPFAAEVQNTQQREIEYFPVKQFRHEFIEEKKDASTSKQAKEANQKAPVKGEADTYTELISKYGDPDRDANIPVVDNAPVPFKAMMESLDKKEDALALRYARQYARHLRNLKDRSNRVVGLVSLGMEQEGMAAPNALSSVPQYNQDRHLLEESKAQSNTAKSYENEIDDEAKEILAQAKSGTLQPAPAIQARLNPQLNERAQIRQSLQGKLTPDPQARVDVMFFFRSTDVKAQAMLGELEALTQKYKSDSRINILALTMEPQNEKWITNFTYANKISFALRDGSRLARIFAIKESPTTVFVTHAGANAHFEVGERKFIYLDEAIRLIQGV